jgi:uncharacterized HAD superfamily protein
MLTRKAQHIIGVDLDNVIACTDIKIRSLISEMFEVHLKQEDLVHFEYWCCGITKQQAEMVSNRFHKTDCQNVIAMEKAIDTLKFLHEYFEIHIVTARPIETKEITLKWLESKAISYDKLFFLKNKHTSSINYEIFIEDHLETALALAQRGIQTLLFNYPWNQPDNLESKFIIRVKSWEDIRQFIEQKWEFKI